MNKELKNIQNCSKEIKTNYHTPSFIDINALSIYFEK
jgi:hypothetical protein